MFLSPSKVGRETLGTSLIKRPISLIAGKSPLRYHQTWFGRWLDAGCTLPIVFISYKTAFSPESIRSRCRDRAHNIFHGQTILVSGGFIGLFVHQVNPGQFSRKITSGAAKVTVFVCHPLFPQLPHRPWSN